LLAVGALKGAEVVIEGPILFDKKDDVGDPADVWPGDGVGVWLHPPIPIVNVRMTGRLGSRLDQLVDTMQRKFTGI
jgi:hypothetical protein